MLYIIQMLVIWLVHIFGKNKRLLTFQKRYKQCLNRQYINNRNKRFSSSWDLYEKKEIFHMLTVLQCYISHILSVLAIKHKYLAYCVSSRSVHPDLSSFITIKTKFWTGSFYFVGNVPWRPLHHVCWWTKLLLHQSEFRCVTGGLKSRLLSHCAYPWCSSASRRPPQTRPFREFLCKPRQIIPSITGSPGSAQLGREHGIQAGPCIEEFKTSAVRVRSGIGAGSFPWLNSQHTWRCFTS